MMLFRSLLACLVATLPLALAQDDAMSALATLPKCAAKCMVTAIETSTCELGDVKCSCTNAPLQAEIEKCVLTSCTVQEAMSTKNTTLTACGAPVRNHRGQFVSTNTVMGILSGLFIVQRFSTKIFLKLPLGLDDLFMVFVACTAVPSITINAYGLAPNGIGRDIWTLTPQQITNFGRYFYIMAILYFCLQTFLKLSMIFFFLRIFPTKGVRKSLWSTVIFTAIFGLVYIFITIFQCRPISYFWTKWDHEHEGTCLDVNAVVWSSASINIALDIWILTIPLSQLKKMNLDWRKKIGVGMMFSVGIFVTIMSILRLSATVQAGTGKGSNNPTWEYIAVTRWSTIEGNVGIICACMPSLRILLVQIFPKILGTSRRGYQTYDKYGSNRPTNGGTNASRSRSRAPLGTTSHVDKTPASRIDPIGITCDRTYEVEYGQTDETHLVAMKDIEMDWRSERSQNSQP
ncbi:hypothetical protein FVEN_g253 [Fusarium venenatum]|uniref:CFEM domain-containing protein n=1 Tax=Fusarium venenatum TaxID=56646 RepID=A0A2L2TJH9_9HYPO|nr:uncharacterized protein FVRRES_07642 [Fusarium venenatum]KAG8361794.1 hypothetical protein FVEN_g253 [Fusarium venenatum]KAH6994541.1 hypothetical protein EDB82DRAFT_537415 [Fusarium venenatum]CEI63206.1 unnamed protein product [Fusarium venenatum]